MQADIVVYGLYEGFQPFGNGESVLQSLLVGVMSEEGEGTDGAVYFRCHYALREETAVHTHRVVLPVFYQRVHVQRGEEGDVLPGQVIGDVVAHTTVRHVDDG